MHSKQFVRWPPHQQGAQELLPLQVSHKRQQVHAPEVVQHVGPVHRTGQQPETRRPKAAEVLQQSW